jgi:hypothetical protein
MAGGLLAYLDLANYTVLLLISQYTDPYGSFNLSGDAMQS